MSAPAAPALVPAASAYERLERATAELTAPFALVDLDALEDNARDMERRAGGKPIRLASKSVRCRTLQERVLARGGFHGTMAFTLPEALWLAAEGTSDVLVAYPTADAEALRELASGGADVTVMVDSAEGLRLIDRALDGAPGRISVCLDIDAGWRAAGGRIRVGARRSPVRSPEDAAALTREVLAREHLALARDHGLRGPDRRRGGRAAEAARCGRVRSSAMQARSARELAGRRGAIVAAVAEVLARGRRAAPALRQRRRDRQPARDGRGGRRHGARGGLRPVRADPLRRLPSVLARGRRPCSRCRSCAGRAAAS